MVIFHCYVSSPEGRLQVDFFVPLIIYHMVGKLWLWLHGSPFGEYGPCAPNPSLPTSEKIWYPLVNVYIIYITMEHHHAIFMGKSTIQWSFSIVLLFVYMVRDSTWFQVSSQLGLPGGAKWRAARWGTVCHSSAIFETWLGFMKDPQYILWWTNIAIENGPFIDGLRFTHRKWWFSIVMLVYQRVSPFSVGKRSKQQQNRTIIWPWVKKITDVWPFKKEAVSTLW